MNNHGKLFSKPEVPTTDSVIPDSPNSPPILFQLYPYPVIPPTGSSWLKH